MLGKLAILLVADAGQMGLWAPFRLLTLVWRVGLATPESLVLFCFLCLRGCIPCVPAPDKLSQPVAGKLSQQWTPPVGPRPHGWLLRDISGVQALNSCFSPSHPHNPNFNSFGKKLATFRAAAARGSGAVFLGSCGRAGRASPTGRVSMSASAGCLVSHLDCRAEFALSGM